MTTTGVPTGNTYDKYGVATPWNKDDVFSSRARRYASTGAPARCSSGCWRARHGAPARSVPAPRDRVHLPDPELAGMGNADIFCMFGDGTAPLPDDAFDLVLAIEGSNTCRPDAAWRVSRVCSGTLIASVPLTDWRRNLLRAVTAPACNTRLSTIAREVHRSSAAPSVEQVKSRCRDDGARPRI